MKTDQPKSLAEIYQSAVNPPPEAKKPDPAIEQAAVEKRIWLASSMTKDVASQLNKAIAKRLAQAQTLALQASPDNDNLIRSLLQQSAVLCNITNLLEGKTETYEAK